MKLKTKILMLALVPVILMTIFVTWATAAKSKEVMSEEIGSGLKANAMALRDAIEMDTYDGYTVDADGELWRDNFKVSECQEMIDNVYEQTGVVMTVCYGDERKVTGLRNEDGSYAVGTKLSPEIVDIVLNQGQDILKDNVDVNGVMHYAYYLPIYDEEGGEPVGCIFAGQNQENVEKKISSIITIVFIVTIVVLAMCVVTVILVGNNITNALASAVKVVREVSRGNLQVRIKPKHLGRKDETGEISRAIQALVDSLAQIMGDIKRQSETLNEASNHLDTTAEETCNVVDQVEVAVQEIASGATSQAEETQKASENVIVMGNMVEETSEETEKLHKNAEMMREMSTQANQILEQLLQSSQNSGKGIEEIYKQTLITNESAKKIKEATELITSIATETNLLSLNASIEAARAGEQGRGFTVVAAQIQKLAEQSNNSARVIEEIISSLLADAEKSVETMEEVKNIIEEQNRSVKQTEEIFEQVIEGIDTSIQRVSVISDKSQKLDDARISVVDTVQNLTAIAEENAASTEETSAATTEVASIVSGVSDSAKQLRKVAEELTRDIQIFQI